MHRDDLAELVRHAVMAPSSHNTQPWTFRVESDAVVVRPDFARRLPVVDPDDHALYISVGCALENLRIAALHRGLLCSVAYFPPGRDADGIRVRLTAAEGQAGEREAEGGSRLFAAIPERQSTRRTFDARPLPGTVGEALEAVAAEPLVSARLITDRRAVDAVAEQVRAACRMQFEDPAFVAELMRWIRFSRREVREHRDGLAANAMGLPFMPRWLGAPLMRRLATAPREAARTAAQVRSSSALMIFSTDEDTAQAWVRAGQSFERMALQAAGEGVKHAHVNMPCEVPAVRERLRSTLDLPGRPVLLIRLGYARARPRSVRRPVAEVVEPGADRPQPAGVPAA